MSQSNQPHTQPEELDRRLIEAFCYCHDVPNGDHTMKCSTTRLRAKALIAQATKDAVPAYLTKVYGPRCKTTDKEDFPKIDYSDPKNGRCIACEMWEDYDSYLAALRGSPNETSN